MHNIKLYGGVEVCHIFNLGPRLAINFTQRPLYFPTPTPRKEPLYTLNGRVGGDGGNAAGAWC